jgi:nucleoside 2-deoxyribosyltransferase
VAIIYLAGGIEGIPTELAAGWREELAGEFTGKHEFLDPMRRQLFSDGGDAASIVENDLRDIRVCDVIAANLLHGACTGTKIEIGYGVSRRCRVIVLVPENQASHPFYTELTTVTTSMEEFKAEIAKLF